MKNKNILFVFLGVLLLIVILAEVFFTFFIFSHKNGARTTQLQQPSGIVVPKIATKNVEPSVNGSLVILRGTLESITTDSNNAYITVGLTTANNTLLTQKILLASKDSSIILVKMLTPDLNLAKPIGPTKVQFSDIHKILQAYLHQDIKILLHFTLPANIPPASASPSQLSILAHLKDSLSCNKLLFLALTSNSKNNPSCTAFTSQLYAYDAHK